jgi:hypothetical protein
MLDRAVQILRIACLVLVLLLVVQLVKVGRRANPLAHAAIPALPTLSADTNNPTASTRPGQSAAIPSKPSSTNRIALANGAGSQTNATNLVSTRATNETVMTASSSIATNVSAKTEAVTNVPAEIAAATKVETNTPTATNAAALAITATNLPAAVTTNGGGQSNPAGTNAMIANSAGKPKAGVPGAPMGMVMPGMGGGRGGPLPELAPEVKARGNRIYESEILGQVMRPLPMGLLGIAGDVAFLRSASGQTGLVKTGDSLGDLKLLRIGMNRVLVEQNGQQKELMIFEGYGGESLISDKGK